MSRQRYRELFDQFPLGEFDGKDGRPTTHGIYSYDVTGSQIICDPPPDSLAFPNTDYDYIVHVEETEVQNIMEGLRAGGWRTTGIFGENSSGRGYEEESSELVGTAKKQIGDRLVNLIFVDDRDAFFKWQAATGLAKKFNLKNKLDRIALFRTVVSGERYYSADETWTEDEDGAPSDVQPHPGGTAPRARRIAVVGIGDRGIGGRFRYNPPVFGRSYEEPESPPRAEMGAADNGGARLTHYRVRAFGDGSDRVVIEETIPMPEPPPPLAARADEEYWDLSNDMMPRVQARNYNV